MSEDKYVLKHEWQESNGKINEKMNQIDNKHTKNYTDLLNRIDKQTILQEKFFESQSKSEQHLEKISTSLSDMGYRVRDLEHDSDTNKKSIQMIQNKIEDEAKGNRDVIVAWISVVGVVLVPIITLVANVFFE
ncbi:hypothetical protein [Staphylococcus auricularis]|uniref:hypothetical protein n=1 Tax=Staphylococcus auricularis TaxID=29379 RepID=UPI001F37B1BE|nr:hypothetical protein [Staphylococcus auricularis]MCE5038387.1 hypothetical protein [Staphylococcus auricularis]